MQSFSKPKLQYFLPPLTMLLLSGCFLAPGSTLKPSTYEDRSWFLQEDGEWFPGLGEGPEIPESELAERVDIRAITPELINAQRSEQAVARPPVDTTRLQQALDNYEYYIGKGDVLNVTVYDHPELTIPAGSQRSAEESGNLVRSDGTIYYPYIGAVNVEGMTVDQVREELAEQLAEFISEPQLDVRVTGFRSKRAYITGQVAAPGMQPISDIPLTVIDAITQSGGLSPAADWHDVRLTRRNGEEVQISVHEILNEGRLDQNVLLQNGDVLHVSEIGNQRVYVLGETNSVISLPMGGLPVSLTQALTDAGGISQVNANASGIFVIRSAPEESEKLATIYQLDASDALAYAVGNRFMLEPADIVFVTTAPVTRWNRVLSQILPSFSAFFMLDQIGQ